MKPPPAGDNGRDGRGWFIAGHRIGKGNPLAARVQQLRFAVVEAVSPEAVKRIILKLIELAEQGDVQAAKVVLERVLGQPVAADLLERLEALEQSVGLEVHNGYAVAAGED